MVIRILIDLTILALKPILHLQIEVRQLFLDFDFLWVGHVDNSLPTGELGTSRVTCGLPAFTHYNAPWAVPTKM